MAFDTFLPQFRVLFPQFSPLSDDAIELYYNQAITIFNETGCAAATNAVLYLTAHLLVIDNVLAGGNTDVGQDGGDGENTSEKVGEVQVTLKPMAETGLATFYTSTVYGRRFLSFRAACPKFAVKARVAVC